MHVSQVDTQGSLLYDSFFVDKKKNCTSIQEKQKRNGSKQVFDKILVK